MSDWSCSCGRTHAADRTKCPGCGVRRDDRPPEPAAAVVSGRRLGGAADGAATARAPSARLRPAAPAAPAAPPPPGSSEPPILRSVLQEGLAPIDPAPPGAPPVALVTRTLRLELPRWCCCCLGPAAGIKHSVAVGERGGFGVDLVDTLIGLSALALTGFGWITFSNEEGFETRLSLPICAPCRQHATALERATIVSGALGFAAFFAGLLLRWPQRAGEVLAPLGAGLGVFVLALVGQALLLPRPGPPCCGSRPVGLRWRGERFTLTFGNPAFGRRVAAMNPRVLE
jgi:hypothetical protein